MLDRRDLLTLAAMAALGRLAPAEVLASEPSRLWLPEGWHTRRTFFRQRIEREAGRVVFCGDSIFEWWRSLPNAFADMSLANRGIAGDTTEGLRLRLDEDVLALRPRGIVLLIGTNDLGRDIPPEHVVTNIQSIVGRIRSYSTNIPIIVCEILPRHTISDPIVEVNMALGQWILNRSDLHICLTYSSFLGPNDKASTTLLYDGLHPSPLGYEQLKANLTPILRQTGLLSP